MALTPRCAFVEQRSQVQKITNTRITQSSLTRVESEFEICVRQLRVNQDASEGARSPLDTRTTLAFVTSIGVFGHLVGFRVLG